MKRYLNSAEVAELLGIPERTLTAWRNTRKPAPRAIRIGRHLRYDPADVEAFMESMKEPA